MRENMKQTAKQDVNTMCLENSKLTKSEDEHEFVGENSRDKIVHSRIRSRGRSQI